MANHSPSSDNPLADFGANEWLVEDMRERYQADPQSVDVVWREFFADQDGGAPTESMTREKAADGPVGEQQPREASASTGQSARAARPVPADQAPAQKAPEAQPAASKPAAPKAAAKSSEDKNPADKAPEDKAGETKADSGAPTPRDAPARKSAKTESESQVTKLRGATARTVTNMEQSLQVPTATSLRAIPAKLLIDNRIVINNHLSRSRGGKVSFTHLIGYAMVKALQAMPEMNNSYTEQDGKPHLVEPGHVNFGLAIDLSKPDGTRQLVVPNIKGAETMDFANFWGAYEDLVAKARDNKLTLEDYQGTTISLTNPGGIGTVSSVPRLMPGQGTIIGVGTLDYPAEWRAPVPKPSPGLP